MAKTKKRTKVDASVTILDVSKIIDSENVTSLSVLYELVDDGVVIPRARLGFPLDTDHEAIVEEVSKQLELYKAEKIRMEENKEFEAANAKADETIAKLTNKKIK